MEPTRVPERWVSPSKTGGEGDHSLLLAPDLLELSRHLESIRRLLAESDERDQGWKSEAWRMIQLLAREVSDDLLGGVITPTATRRTSDALWARTAFARAHTRDHLVANTSGDVTTVIDETTGKLLMYFAHRQGETAVSWESMHGPANWTMSAWPADNEVELEQHAVGYWGHALRAPAADVQLIVEPTPTQVDPDESHTALRAFAELKRWLWLSDEETADVAEIGRTTPYAWQRGTVPRPSTVRQLYELHGIIAAVARRHGERGLQEWLNEPHPEAGTPLAALREGDVETFRKRSRDELFSESPRRQGDTVLPDADVRLTGKSAAVPLRRKRVRRRRDR